MNRICFNDWVDRTIWVVILALLVLCLVVLGRLMWTYRACAPEGGVYVFLDDGTRLGGTFEGTEGRYWLVRERLSNMRWVTYHIDPDKVMAWREEP